jgi:hypothetical protein
MRAITFALSSLAIAGVFVAGSASGASADASADIRNLVVEVEQRHPNPYHSVARTDFHRAADDLAARAPALRRDQLVVGVMRLMAMLGERDGHSGVFPIQPAHGQTLHAFPIRLYRFPEGLYVIRAEDASLVGARVVSIGGVPAAEVEERIQPLVPRDNDSSRLFGLPYYVVVAEALSGLELAPTWVFETRDGARREVVLEPLTVGEWIARLGGGWWQGQRRPPLFLRLSRVPFGLSRIDRGRALYVTYNQTTDPGLVPRKLVRLARKQRVRQIVVDVRLNGGGDNTSYGPLLRALRHPRVNRAGRLRVLIGRMTFSAAGNFAADADRRTRARLYGEPTGGAPSQWGDSAPIPLPSLGITASTAVEYVGDPDDTRTATNPDVPVQMTAADWFAGRDPVLAAALR